MAEDRTRRRLAAIVVADVVGFSRLIREDETGTLARLKSLREDVIDPKVAAFGGRIVNIVDPPVFQLRGLGLGPV